MSDGKLGDLRVWWVPQVPMKPFHVDVKTIDEAILILDTLARYDLFQLDNNIKGDYCNAGGLVQFEDDGQWCEWYDDDGNNIDDVMREREES